jgi:hypothetical protein
MRRTPAKGVLVRLYLYVAFATAVLVLEPVPARAQIYESVGIRAQGMAGAFVGVADDATATWWNPAGVARGAYLSVVLELDRVQEPADDRDSAGRAQAAWRSSGGGVAAAFPALGLSYYRLRVSQIEPSSTTGLKPLDRLDLGPGDVRLRTLVLQQFGATVGHSIGESLVVATTLKLLEGSVGVGVRTAADATLAQAESLSGSGSVSGDADIGAMWSRGPAQVGAVLRNVFAPSFGNGTSAIQVPRQGRVGIAVSSNRTSLGAGVTADVDVDVNRTPTPTGDARHLAGGVEAWNSSRRLAVRAGISVNTVDDARVAASGGASVALRPGLFVDAVGTAGSDTARRGWALGLRVTF